MQAMLREALEAGAVGLSTGLAYASASSASTAEVVALARLLGPANALYATHLRDESAHILEAMEVNNPRSQSDCMAAWLAG
jgi:N-acyl-D-amino-acid deacylase